MGTLNYMAPEQVRGERADQRSDIFSMGVVLYELFGGRRAFEGDSVASTLYKILEVTPAPLSQIDPTLSPALAAIVDRAMAKLRDERYPDMTALRVDLETFRQQHLAAGPATPATMPMTPGRAPPTGPRSNAATPGRHGTSDRRRATRCREPESASRSQRSRPSRPPSCGSSAARSRRHPRHRR